MDTAFDSNEFRRQWALTGEAYVGGVAFDGRLDVEAEAGRPGDLNMRLSRLMGDGSEPADGCRATGEAGMGGDEDAKEERARREDPAKATLDRKEEEEIRDSPT
jgi:hypothetical protein